MLIVHLFVSYAYVNLCHLFSSSWSQGLAATSACGSSCTFLFTFFVGTDEFYEVKVGTYKQVNVYMTTERILSDFDGVMALCKFGHHNLVSKSKIFVWN